MRKIRQRHRSGCTVASLAILLGISYNKALNILYPDHQPYQRIPGDLDKIVEAFKRAKVKTIFHMNFSKLFLGSNDNVVEIKSFKNPALLCIYQQDFSKFNHAVVWDPITKKVLDPGRKRNLPVSYYQRRLSFAFEVI